MSDTLNFEAHGLQFRATIVVDDCCDAPWDNSDGHGPVRQVHGSYRGSRCEKRPGERILHSDRGTYWLYDWQAACKAARRDGWNAKPYDAPHRVQRAVQADFDFLRGWLTGDWYYVGISVRMLDADGQPEGDNEALYGIESSSHDYIEEVARDLAHELARSAGRLPEQKRAAWRGAMREARERRYWAQRDVPTI